MLLLTDLNPSQSTSNGSNITYKWVVGILLTLLLGGIPIVWTAFSSTESQSTVMLRERVTSLEVRLGSVDMKLDELKRDMRERTDEILRRVDRRNSSGPSADRDR